MATKTSNPKRKVNKEEPLIVNVVRQADGYTFALDPVTSQRIRRMHPGASLPARSFVAFDVRTAFEQMYRPIVDHIIPLLTGLSAEELKLFAGVSFYDPWNEEKLGEWHPNDPLSPVG